MMSQIFKIFFILFCFNNFVINPIVGENTANKECNRTGIVPLGLINEVIIPTDKHNFNLELTWIGENNKKMIVITSDQEDSNVFLSDASKSYNYTNINSRLGEDIHSAVELSLVKHATNKSIVYFLANFLMTQKTSIYISRDEGNTFQVFHTSFKINGLIFHPNMEMNLMTIDEFDHNLYFSTDYGENWIKIKSDVIKAKWSTVRVEDIYVIVNENSNKYIMGLIPMMKAKDNVMERSSDFGATWKVIQKNVFSFGLEDEFLFNSIFVDPESDIERRVLMVSTNRGDNWNQVKVPEISQDSFYSILDMSDGQILLHVDQAGDTGKGTLYTSDATGILFSESLANHLYPNFDQITDFYKVESMRGVYITNVLASDDSIQSRITFNRGADWQMIPKPEGIECEDHSHETCYLHIHNLYSIQNGVKSLPPKSVASAIGLILVHGNAAESLQTTESNVFVSSDGGHTWRFSLKGPHHYVIGDHGGLIAAVQTSEGTEGTAHILKLSTDEGRCWEEYEFTSPGSFTFKDLLIEPSSTDMVVAVWGYTVNKSLWMTYIFNFSKVIPNKCTDNDYEEWSPTDHSGKRSCLLGVKEVFIKIKPNSLCFNGQSKQLNKTKETCPCTTDDYNCDYGYVRKGEDCVKDKSNNLPEIGICYRNHKERIVLKGYHKIPGDKCDSINQIKEGEIVNLTEECPDEAAYLPPKASFIKKQIEKENQKEEKNRKVIFMTLSVFVVICVIVIVTIVARKYKVFRRPTVRYQSIQSGDIIDNNNIDNHGNGLNIVSSDDDGLDTGYSKDIAAVKVHMKGKRSKGANGSLKHSVEADGRTNFESDVELIE